MCEVGQAMSALSEDSGRSLLLGTIFKRFRAKGEILQLAPVVFDAQCGALIGSVRGAGLMRYPRLPLHGWMNEVFVLVSRYEAE